MNVAAFKVVWNSCLEQVSQKLDLAMTYQVSVTVTMACCRPSEWISRAWHTALGESMVILLENTASVSVIAQQYQEMQSACRQVAFCAMKMCFRGAVAF